MAATETADAFDYEAAVAAFIAGFRLSDIDAEAMSGRQGNPEGSTRAPA